MVVARILSLILGLVLFAKTAGAQHSHVLGNPTGARLLQGNCSASSALACSCPTESPNCDLLPDLVLDTTPLTNGGTGLLEYAYDHIDRTKQGQLRVTSSILNLGSGPLHIRRPDQSNCSDQDCESGDLQHFDQVIYQKNGPKMTTRLRPASQVFFDPLHGHHHTKSLQTLSLRLENKDLHDPRDFPVVGQVGKIDFCLADVTSCLDDPAACNLENHDLATSLPNGGFGGGGFKCLANEQGISVGYADIYNQTYAGQAIQLPENTCNGAYVLVSEIDPQDVYLEEDETNNFVSLPVRLTQQREPFADYRPTVSVQEGSLNMCHGEEVQLLASPAYAYRWSTGETTQSITVKATQNLWVEVQAPCGQSRSDILSVQVTKPLPSPLINFDENTETWTANHEVNWVLQAADGSVKRKQARSISKAEATGFKVKAQSFAPRPQTRQHFGPERPNAEAQASSSRGGLVLHSHKDQELERLWLASNGAGRIEIQLTDFEGQVLQSKWVNVQAGGQWIKLGFDLSEHSDTILTLGPTTDPSLLQREEVSPTFFQEFSQNDAFEIRGSTHGPRYYFYFYNFVLRDAARLCFSPATLVN